MYFISAELMVVSGQVSRIVGKWKVDRNGKQEWIRPEENAW